MPTKQIELKKIPSFYSGSRSSRLQLHEKRKRNTPNSMHSLSEHNSVSGKVFKSYQITSMTSKERKKTRHDALARTDEVSDHSRPARHMQSTAAKKKQHPNLRTCSGQLTQRIRIPSRTPRIVDLFGLQQKPFSATTEEIFINDTFQSSQQ